MQFNTRKTKPNQKVAKYLNRHFSKDLKMANKHMKRCSTSFTTREIELYDFGAMTEFTRHLFIFLHFSYKKLVCKQDNKYPCSSTNELAAKVTVMV